MDWSRPLKNTNDSRYIYGKHSVQHSGTSHSNRGLALLEQSAQRSSKLPPPTPLKAHTLAGIEPENWFSSTKNSFKFWSWPGSISGIAPESPFPERKRSLSEGELPQLAGSVPVSRFPLKYNIRIVGMSNIVDGKVPVNWFALKSAKSRVVQLLNPSRIVPEKLLLLTPSTPVVGRKKEKFKVRNLHSPHAVGQARVHLDTYQETITPLEKLEECRKTSCDWFGSRRGSKENQYHVK